MATTTGRWRAHVDAILWHLLPGICVFCNESSGVPMDLCPHCHAALPWLLNPCPQCALPQVQSGAPRCGACAAQPPPFVRAVAAMRYADAVARMIQHVKFAGNRIDARVLGSLLGEQVTRAYCDEPLPDVIVPVPLSSARLLRRGHNQAALIARWVGHACATPVDYDLCARTRHTPAQTGLGRSARLRNLHGAFAARRPVAGLRIAILDDVMTTGATVTALARTLLAANAKAVHVWAVARTLEPQPQPIPAAVLLESPG